MGRQGLAGARVLLGVSGGIAAYKAAALVRRLRDAGADVRVVLTANAARFVTPLTFQALSGNPVRTGLWDEAAEAAMGHIELARWADLVLIAPASADLLARIAHGHADDLLATVCLVTTAPLAVAPAMNQQMWAHPATQANMAVLRGRGVRVLGPASGDQACFDALFPGLAPRESAAEGAQRALARKAAQARRRLQPLFSELLALEVQLARETRLECDSEPGPPCSPKAIAASPWTPPRQSTTSAPDVRMA